MKGPSCPWCRKVSSVAHLPRQVGADHSYICEDCNLTFSGSTEEYHACHRQRELAMSIRDALTPTPPTQEELPTDA